MRTLTRFESLDKVRTEWPWVDWEAIVGRNWTVRSLGNTPEESAESRTHPTAFGAVFELGRTART